MYTYLWKYAVSEIKAKVWSGSEEKSLRIYNTAPEVMIHWLCSLFRKVETVPAQQPATRWESEGSAVEIPLNRTPGQKFKKHQCSPRSAFDQNQPVLMWGVYLFNVYFCICLKRAGVIVAYNLKACFLFLKYESCFIARFFAHGYCDCFFICLIYF
jgi:hypothetical protein